jgi:hypothetical protein
LEVPKYKENLSPLRMSPMGVKANFKPNWIVCIPKNTKYYDVPQKKIKRDKNTQDLANNKNYQLSEIS